MKKVLYIGPAPQNIGGISMHIRRLVCLLNDEIIVDYIDEGHTKFDGIFNLRSKNLFKYFKKVIDADVIHIHSGIWMLRAFHIFVCKILLRKHVVVTIHRDPTIEPHFKLTRCLLKRCNHAILVNQKGYDSMLSASDCNYHLLPAFLPPIMQTEPQLPNEIKKWLISARTNENSTIMCSNAWNLVLHKNQDLYGLDMCIDAIIKLNNKNYFLIFVVASNTNQQDRMKSYKRKIAEYSLQNNILIWEESTSFVRLIQESDIVLRTTNTDGDAISIREALYFDKPVIASDVIARPEGTILFKNRNTEDLVEKIIDIQNNKIDKTNSNICDYKQIYLNMYKQKNK